MTAGDGDFTVPGRLCRPSPSTFKKTAPSPSGPRTDGGKPSVPVLSDPGRTGRLISLVERPATDIMEGSRKSDGLESGQRQRRADHWAVSVDECDQAVMDFVAATEVGNFPPK
jgi:hypothetical protein